MYKRQLYLNVGQAPENGRITDVNVVLNSTNPKASIGLVLNNRARKAPVSYTHLDVYKRQGYCYAIAAGFGYVGERESRCVHGEEAGLFGH